MPQRECALFADAAQIQDCCVQGLRHSVMVLAVLDGADADSGTAGSAAMPLPWGCRWWGCALTSGSRLTTEH